MFDRATLTEVASLLREAARTEILPRFRRLGADGIRAKNGPFDLVTDADEIAERRIAAALEARFPGCLIVGEEGCAADPSLLPRLAGAPLAFILDPVDGTANFVAGVPLFGVMAAAVRHGEIVAGWIHDPFVDDTAIAAAGQGAWLEDAAGARTTLRVAPARPLEQMKASISFRYLPEPLRQRVACRMPRFGAHFEYHCAAHAYRVVTAGHAHVLLFNRTMPWDHAAGWLLHRESGGYAARFDGSPYSVLETTGGLIAAPDRETWEAVRATMLDP
ncbi:inositol monophosphatase [Roseomonas sp. NAR14]|uniref:Inositol monophosphatase n=1 Tax=Roseomonas acroporae TaxID=2937791 RepID=A0A9X1Y5B7_9PROT|nr:inositol monophosphatase family protein [Roseomonas acroporae]MCK8783738.1 inositol monophosphatase [Roseomonas acroporae]